MPTEIAKGLIVETLGDLLDGGATPHRADPPQPGASPESTPAGDQSDNERVRLGGNNPPPDEPALTPYDLVKQEIDDLFEEAKGWLDGEPIANAAQAEELNKLRDLIRKAEKKADAERVRENEPFDKGKAEVQARYNALIKKDVGKTAMAIKAINQTLAPWLKKVDEEQRAEAARLQAEAQRLANEAREKAQAAAATGNLAAKEEAENAISHAKEVQKDANRAEKAKPQVGGTARRTGLKTVRTAVLIDPKEALAHMRKVHPKELKDWMREQAQKDVDAKATFVPGFRIDVDKVPS